MVRRFEQPGVVTIVAEGRLGGGSPLRDPLPLARILAERLASKYSKYTPTRVSEYLWPPVRCQRGRRENAGR